MRGGIPPRRKLTMNIAKVGELYELTPDTLRYYEKMGLIPPVHRNAAGIRDYDDEDCRNVEFVKCLRAAGMSVERISEFVRLSSQDPDGLAKRLELLAEQRRQLSQRMEQLEETMRRLDYKINFFTEKYEASRKK